MDNEIKLYKLYKKHNLSEEDIKIIDEIIQPIFTHSEFQLRMTNKFYHHGKVTLGEHILEDAIVSYKLAKKSKKNLNIKLVVIIAMLHDLYTEPYQNVKKVKEKSFFNKHGFRHPIEAVINSYHWYPELFNSYENAKIIIDGIVHHMYPLPVQVFCKDIDNKNDLKNYDLLDDMPDDIIDILIECTHKKCVKNISLANSKYAEGRIISRADKIVTAGQIKDFKSMMALLTGKNSSLLKEIK